MYVNEMAIMYIVDEGTHFSAARSLANVCIYEEIMEINLGMLGLHIHWATESHAR